MASPPDLESAVAILAVRQHLLDPETAWAIIQDARDGIRPVVTALRQSVSEDDLLRAIAAESGIKFYDLYSQHQEYRVPTELVERADINALRRYIALPMFDPSTQSVVVAVAYLGPDQQQYLRNIYRNPSFVLAPAYQIQDRLAALGAGTEEAATAPRSIDMPVARTLARPPSQVGAQSPIVELADNVLSRAVANGASDVHMSFDVDKQLLIWFRIDGSRRRQRIAIPGGRGEELLATFMARCPTMDSSNRLDPQDGTFSFSAAGRQIDARLAMLPEANGPELAIRILDSRNLQTRLDDMGFSNDDLAKMRKVLLSSQGTVLVVGPTGSGKSTTSYGLLREIDAESRHVITVEDPVEYRLSGVNQTQVTSNRGDKSLTFARALRTILRMDPDVILVGEIRDTETAKVAMDASITGHLVLSTIHAPSAVGVFTRLVEMGVSPYLPAEAISLVVSQRLVRKVHECARLEPPSSTDRDWFESLGLEVPPRVARPVGCDGCNATGYRGRLAVVEVLEPDRALREAATMGLGLDQLIDVAVADGFRRIQYDAAAKVTKGVTTVAEVRRVMAT